MAKKSTAKKHEFPLMRLIVTLTSTVVAALILVFSVLTIITFTRAIDEGATDIPAGVPFFILGIFLLSGLMSVIKFFKDRTKANLIKSFVMIGFDVALGIAVLFAANNPFLFVLTAGLYCVTLVVARVFNIIDDHSIRSIILNGLIILLAVGLSIGIFISPISNMEQLQNIIVTECVFIAIVAFVEAMAIALANLKVKVLFKIILSTYSLEVLFGLLVTIVCFSLVFMTVEPQAADPSATNIIRTFPDALWYCFAVVTTIGFGDLTAITPIGRILTVILGMYGLVVVAVITSIVVNFYNETSGKHDQKELKEIQKEEENNK